MKKSLIALAVMAVAGTAFAQTVTLSGKLGFAYEKTSSTTYSADTVYTGVADTTDTNGLGVTDGDFVLRASEDLGSGLKATATMAVKNRGRGEPLSGRDASLTLSGGFGTVLIGRIEAGNGILGLGGADSPGMYGLDDGIVLSAPSNVDILRYYTPTMSGFRAYVSLIDAATTGGMESDFPGADLAQIGVTYASGPIAAAADYAVWDDNNAPAPRTDNRLRMSGSYDLGMAKLGLGYEVRKYEGFDRKEWVVGVAAPFGPVTVGVNYATRKDDGVAQDASGWDFGAEYNLSKRTSMEFAYYTVEAGALAGEKQDTEKAYRIKLLHKF